MKPGFSAKILKNDDSNRLICNVQDDTEKVDGILQYLLHEIKSLPDGTETSVLELVDSAYKCLDYNDGVLYYQDFNLTFEELFALQTALNRKIK